MTAKNTDDCKEPGVVMPEINRNACEGKEDCVKVCPYDVFEMGTLNDEQRSGLSMIGKLKAFAHGYHQAFVVKPEACHNCGACVTACPEKAITLKPVKPRA